MVRDRERTKARIVDAVAGLLIRSGFRTVGVNAVAAAAGVDKVLIYRYFGGLAGLLEVVAAEPDLWPTTRPGRSSGRPGPHATDRPPSPSCSPPSLKRHFGPPSILRLNV